MMGKWEKGMALLCIAALAQTGCGSRAEPDQIGIQTASLDNQAGQGISGQEGNGSSVPGQPDNGTGASGTGNSTDGERASLDFDREAMLAAYISVLEKIYSEHIFPDGKDYGYESMFDMSENRFAVYDIDQDAKEELVIEYATTYMAGMVAMICDYDSASGNVKVQFSEFPFLTYYDNGVIQAEWSHNQGLAGDRDDFWPYTLYQYNQETDSYAKVRMVDGWSKSRAEKDYEGNPFPDEIDADGDGFLYYVMTVGEYGINTLVDGEEYNQWRDSYLEGAEIADIPFLEMTEENIRGIAGK